MIDAIPEGYTTLPAAVTLLAATIAEVDVAGQGLCDDCSMLWDFCFPRYRLRQ